MSARVKLQSENGRPVMLLLGAGYTAKAMIPALIARGVHVIATTRSPDKHIKALGVTNIMYEGNRLPADVKSAISKADFILSSIPPNDGGDPVLWAADMPTLAANAKWIGYLSATSVYGNRNGQWAFEDEPPKPMTKRGKRRAEAEIAWIETGLPVHIFRLAGIYGPGRSPFDKTLGGEARAVIKPGHIVNRIHVDDIAAAVMASMDAPNPQRIYNVADGNPAPPQDVLDYAADLLGAGRPPRVSPDDPNVSRMARTFYAETKRVDISRAKKELGFTPLYPTYREGLAQVMKAENRKPIGITLTGYIDIPDADVKIAQAALPEHIRATQDEDGCLNFRVTQDAARPHRYHVYERFTGEAAFHAHQSRAEGTAWAKATQNATREYTIFGLK